MRNIKRFRVLLVVLICVFSQMAFADVRLPSVIDSRMVLQQGSDARIWGWAEPGEKVEVKPSWASSAVSTVADKDGNWSVALPTPDTFGPYEITVKGNNTIELTDVLIGQVWVCSGQSNMEWRVISANNAEQEIAAANYPNIRLFTVKKTVSDEPQSDCEGSWQVCTPQTVKNFSAVGYYFGRKLHKELRQPVGLVHTSWGGTPAEAWTKRAVLEADSDFAPILRRYTEAYQVYPQAKKEYDQKMEQRKKDVARAEAEGKERPPKPRSPLGPGHSWTPSGLYNAMLAPLLPYRIKGFIWYQGESNAGRAYQYRKLFGAMINNWRDDWGQGDLAFGFVQLANYTAKQPEPNDSDWAELREAQLMTLALPNTGMAVTIDIGDANTIHPRNKQDVGKRLALWALAKTYGRDIVYSGPIYKSMQVETERIYIKFDHAGSGLRSSDGGQLTGFAIAGADRKFVWATANIIGPDTIEVYDSTVQKPVAVRYAWAHNPACNLSNKEGLPASPFRTDDFPAITVNNK